MASGKIHDKFTKQITFPLSLTLAAVLFPIVGWLGSGIGFVLSYLGFSLQRVMTPDLDVDAGFYGFFLIQKNLGKLAAFFWRVFWYPYARFLPHRGFFSHSPLFSTLFRMIYLFIIPSVVVIYFTGFNVFFYWDFWIYFGYGIICADLGHLLLDYLPDFREWYQSTIDGD